MKRHRAEWWQQRVEELERGASVDDIARRHEVRPATLVWWRSELERRGRSSRKQRLLPVVLQPMQPASIASAPDSIEVVIEAGSTRVTVRGHLDVARLAAVMAVIRG